MTNDERVKHVAEAIVTAYDARQVAAMMPAREMAEAAIAAVFETLEVTDKMGRLMLEELPLIADLLQKNSGSLDVYNQIGRRLAAVILMDIKGQATLRGGAK